MKRSYFGKLSLLFIVLVSMSAHAQETRYVGGDISTLPLYEKYNSAYKDVRGNSVSDLLRWFVTDCGWNTFRVRIFVNPSKKDHGGTTNPSVCQDLAYVTALGQRIKAAGAYFMLDFHYSDTWVDATHIQAPAAWKGASDAAMADSIAAYTRRVLTTLKDSNATPDLVQVGNEIMYGLCGIQVHPYEKSGDNWTGYLGLLKAGCNTVREVCPNAQIIIHTDRPTNTGYNSFYYNKLVNGGVDFDVIGLSYYPFWHGYLTAEQVKNKDDKNNLVNAIHNLKTLFPAKRVQIVECAYNFQWWPSSGVNFDTRDAWTCDVAGQYKFVKDLVDALKPLENVDGINYWFPEEAGNGDKGNVIPSWQNRGFWDEAKTNSGHAINKTGNVTGDKTAADVCAPYYLGTFVEHQEEGLDQTPFLSGEGQGEALKLLRNGQIIILRNGVEYTPAGLCVAK
ncbi:MAG: glycosyl hydrolase 53 family protein [Paludibacteraceae bacterium]|nr:glycosyl hydrolase 53 family protein [Paludibacteraceae bacterium]